MGSSGSAAGGAARRLLRTAGSRGRSLRPELRRGEREGTFIVFEGVEGSGKGTQIRLAAQYLEELGFDVMVTREPGGTEMGERLRDVLMDREVTLDPRAEALLFTAARAQHVVSVIRPALAKGNVVLCDRFVDSSVAYQGAARGLGDHDIQSLSEWATQGLGPDLVIVLDLDPEEGLSRSGGDDRFEGEGKEFHAEVAGAYLRRAKDDPDRFAVVDATGGPVAVHQRVREVLRRFLRIEEADEEASE